MRGNPVFHDYPPNPLTVARMHHELHMSRHADCTPETCAMIWYCRGRLIELGRLNPDDAPGECSACRDDDPSRSTSA
ncbi:hypothetical protein K7711_03260 [Nocardia sp. CA2R105]|uniref:hypothetical protein n=1 Tax=Nocardia coffeae TaxID=2873381 RepID=UPI001CA6E042|nr:hypothetical protein [Nocardia coffeae]MBY8855487.1 hypothetical protein [Nocardia coffeae]